jgi:DNA replication protein DnaC
VEITDSLASLGLDATDSQIEELISRATGEGWSFNRFLSEMFSQELASRARKREAMLMRLAHLPQVKTLASFDLAAVPDLAPR